MDAYKCCRYCRKGVYVPVDMRTMCAKFGLVSQKHVCPQFELDPFKIRVQRMHNMDFSKFEKENYSIEVEEDTK